MPTKLAYTDNSNKLNSKLHSMLNSVNGKTSMQQSAHDKAPNQTEHDKAPNQQNLDR